jgi:hypothetical protein
MEKGRNVGDITHEDWRRFGDGLKVRFVISVDGFFT